MSATAIVMALVRHWTWLYTAGLDERVRNARRDEIASDLWEQWAEGGNVAASVALRWLLGVPADLSWRLEESGVRSAPARAAAAVLARAEWAARWANRRGLPGLTMLLAALYVLGGALVVITLPANDNPDRGGVFVFGAWCVLAGGLIGWGSRLVAGRPWAGLIAICAGAVPLGLVLTVTVVIPVATAAVVGHAVIRARRAWRARRTLPGLPVPV